MRATIGWIAWDGASDTGDLIGPAVPITDSAQFAPERDGLRLIEEQRRRPSTSLLPGLNPAVRHRIGVGSHLYRITKHGVTAELLRDWQDEIAQAINPL